MIRVVDTHLHLDSEHFDGQRAEVVKRAEAAGVAAMVTVGTSAESSRRVLELSRQFASVVAAVGIQPNDVIDAEPGDWAVIEDLVRGHRDEIVAIGETGLDCYWDRTPLAMQQDYFDRHLALARACDLPVIIHMRESGRQIVEQLRRASSSLGPVSGVMHSFTGDSALMEECLDLGLHISFAGMVTFKKSDALREVARQVPLERILVETDSPYLSPEPLRGRRPNEPARVIHTVECLSKAREMPLEDFAAATTANACRLFGLTL